MSWVESTNLCAGVQDSVQAQDNQIAPGMLFKLLAAGAHMLWMRQGLKGTLTHTYSTAAPPTEVSAGHRKYTK